MSASTKTKRSGRAGGAIWSYIAALTAAAAVVLWLMADWGPAFDGPHIPWWTLVVGFAVAERLVLHLRLRKDAHSFSMSEIPLVIALFLATPLATITAQLVANGLVLTLHRRQQPVKLAFNLAQFGLQTGVAFVVARSLMGSTTDPLGLVAWMAALAGALAALATADLLIDLAITLTGGSLTRSEAVSVLALGSLGTIMNTSLALVAVTLLMLRPSAALLGLAPPLILFVAYRAYVKEREEGARLEALYDATKELHASPQIEAALTVAVITGRRMLDAAYSEVFLFPSAESTPAYRTSSGPGNEQRTMRPVAPSETHSMAALVAATEDGLLTKPIHHVSDHAEIMISDAIVVPLIVGTRRAGYMLVANRLDDVSTFAREDVRLLETVAAQVSISLENGRLEHSLTELNVLKEQLEELVRSKDELVASVSHELRTPLTAVVGLAEELRSHRSEFSADESEELMGLIADQSGELAEIVDDLLVAARAQTGSLNLRQESIDVETELAELIDRFGTDSSLGLVDLRTGGEPTECVGDALRIRQVVRNLLSNADRYGGDTAWVEISSDQSHAVISVCDNGAGVPPESAAAIFEPYQRADGEVHHPLSVGLGLAVSRKLARLMGGDLLYRRSDGVTRFEFSIPISATEAALAS